MYEIDEKEIEAIRKVFSRKKLFRYQLAGPGECDLFEKEFSEKIGTQYSILVTSGTNALIAALASAGIGPGDEVIIPSYTFVATAAAVTNVGAVPVIADIDETLGISPKAVRNKITSRTRAIIPVHMDGLAADMRSIMEVAAENKLIVIEDVAQAIGGRFREKYLGSWGDFGCFSLNENKNISAGEGGIVATSRRDFYERAFCVQDASAQFNPAKKDMFCEIKPFIGSSMRVSEITGALMRVQLERLDAILSGLRKRKLVLVQRLSDCRNVKIILGNCREGDCASSLHLLFPNPETTAKASQELKKQGILFAPVTARPAHVCWKWMPLLDDRASYIKSQNPYQRTEASYSYQTADYLDSVSILTRTLKADIDLNWTPTETEKWADIIRKTLENV